MAELKEGFVQAAGYRTHYWEAGTGENVLLLHSADPGSGGRQEFRHNLGPLSERFHVVAPDQIGFGKTDPPPALLTHPTYVEHIVAFMGAVGFQRAHLIGNSRGGLVAISIAGEHPERIGRVILAGNAGGGIPPEMVKQALSLFADYKPGRENLRTVLQRSYFDLDRSMSPAMFDEYLEASTRQYDAYARLGGYPMDVPNLRAILASLTMPVMFFFGKEDKVFAIEQGLVGFVNTPGSRFYGFSNCGHHPQVEHPGEFNRLAIDFLTGQLA